MNPSQQSAPVLVIGATGKVGRRVVEQLTDRGVEVRAASRSSAFRFDWEDPSTWQPTLNGVSTAFVTSSDVPVDIEEFLRTAEQEGLLRLVLLSMRQPDQGGDPWFPAIEAAFGASSVPSVILRPSWFVQNFTEGMFGPAVAAGELHLPVGMGLEPFIDATDIAEVAVAALTSAAHDGRTYELSGPELLSFGQAVQHVAASTGQPAGFVDTTPQAWAQVMASELPPPVIDLLLNLFAAIRRGDNAYLSDGVRQALGRPPRSFMDALGA